MTRLCLMLLASCAAAQASRPPATSVINDQHTTGGTGPVTSAQAYVRPPAPETPPPTAIPRASSDATTGAATGTATDAQLVKAELSECKHKEPPLVVARAEPPEPLCAATKPKPRPRHHRGAR